ncbi:MAG: hypothetical protein GVY08_04860 [Bacteroidetes bacterium]|jgi:hypothetical protein|nr:hypothetical protein [Bacteroidota bacterium]
MKNYLHYLILICICFFMAGSTNIGVNQEVNNEVFIENSEVINFNVYDGDECYLFLCTDDKGKVTDAACLESDDDDGTTCTGCTPPCEDSDLGEG